MTEYIRLRISPRILPSIATLYDDVSRIFLEYIDNSLDSAEAYFESQNNSYLKPIEISLGLSGRNSCDGKVVVYDNCAGITNLPKVVDSVGDSDKKAQPWTNGQFGYGIYSFLACCSRLEITSQTEHDLPRYISIDKEKFDTERQEDVVFPAPKAIGRLVSQREGESLCLRALPHVGTGTKIALSGFDNDSWKEIDIGRLREEIEKHFEVLLARKNLTIRLVAEGVVSVCQGFDYTQFEGETYVDEITELTNTRRGGEKETFRPRVPIKVFIKITKGREINKRPVFIAKGRRICDIKETRSFRSKHKSELWDHPNVTGYVDLSDFLEPMINRTDFRRTGKRKALYGVLFDIEDLLLDLVKDVNKASEESHYRELEDRINRALSHLAKLDALKFRKEYVSGGDTLLEEGGGVGFEEGKGMQDQTGISGTGGGGKTGGVGEGDGLGIGDIPGNQPGGEGAGPSDTEADVSYEDAAHTGKERRRSGFNVRIVDTEPNINLETDEPVRSELVGGEIRVYKRHPDFTERVKGFRSGKQKITSRLVTYLAGEVTVHYKDKFHTKAGQPVYDKGMFSDLVAFIYRFESMLSDLVGQNLSDLEK